MPQRSALRPWRKIAGGAGARVAEASGYDGDLPRIVELIAGDAEPFTEPVATPVLPGNAALVRRLSRGLSDDQNSRGRICRQQRPRTKRKLGRTNGTRASFGQNREQRWLGSRLPQAAAAFHACAEKAASTGVSAMWLA